MLYIVSIHLYAHTIHLYAHILSIYHNILSMLQSSHYERKNMSKFKKFGHKKRGLMVTSYYIIIKVLGYKKKCYLYLKYIIIMKNKKFFFFTFCFFLALSRTKHNPF